MSKWYYLDLCVSKLLNKLPNQLNLDTPIQLPSISRVVWRIQ